MNKKRIVIIGAGGHAKELYSYISDLISSDEISFAGFVDEHKPIGRWEGSQVIGGFGEFKDFLRCHKNVLFYYITAVGDNKIRERFVHKIEEMKVLNLKAWSFYHPCAVIGEKVEIGEGSCLAPGSIVTTHVKIGKHCILNVNASVSHDCIIGDYVNINPGAVICGNVRMGRSCYIGAKATVIDKISIGEATIIGAGAVVTKDMPTGVTAVGIPAKIIKRS